MHLSVLVFSTLLTIPLFIEGLGLSQGHQLMLFYYILLPSVLFFYTTLKKKPIYFPVKLSLVYLIFIIFSAISATVFSVDKQVSFESLLFFISAYFIFIFFNNHHVEGKKTLRVLLIAGSITFSLVSFGLFFFRNIIPSNEYQFIYSYYVSHNHLGDFLGLSLILLWYSYLKKGDKKYLLLMLFCLPFFFTSFSRSAYIAFLIPAIWLFLRHKRVLGWVIISLILIISLFFALNTWQTRQYFHIGAVYDNLPKILQFQRKNLSAGRLEYLTQAYQSFLEKPYFGLGLSNFGYASHKYLTNPNAWTDTAHNLFFDILVENGMLASIFFVIFILLILKKSPKKSVFFFLLLYLLLNFQFDYIYRIYGFFILFMLIAGINYEEDKKIKGNIIYGVSGLVLFAVVEVILASYIFLNSKTPEKNIAVYPFNKLAYAYLVKENQQSGNYNNAVRYGKKLEEISPYDLNTLITLANLYNGIKEPKKALFYYERSYQLNPYISLQIAEKIYFLKKKVQPSNEAYLFLKEILTRYKRIKYMSPVFNNQVRNFCQKTGEKKLCNSIGWSVKKK